MTSPDLAPCHQTACKPQAGDRKTSSIQRRDHLCRSWAGDDNSDQKTSSSKNRNRVCLSWADDKTFEPSLVIKELRLSTEPSKLTEGKRGDPNPLPSKQFIKRRDRPCRSWAGNGVAESNPPPTKQYAKRRHRVCKSWNGYGTLVEDQEAEGDEEKASPLPQATMKPPSRWIDGLPSLKSLVHRPVSRSSSNSPSSDAPETASPSRVPLMHSAEDPGPSLSSSSPSMLTLMRHDAYALPRSYNPLPSSDISLHSSCGSLVRNSDVPMRKCSTLVTLSSLEPIRPINRLRMPSVNSLNRMCSRCSSLLSMASSSRYSLNAAGGGFVPVRSASVPLVLCKLCLGEVPSNETCTIMQCGCAFCNDCMRGYVEFEIQEGAYDISCPDAQCVRQGVISLSEVQLLVSEQHMEKYKRFRLNREVDMDVSRLWCPKAGCETVCHICPMGERCLPQSVRCPTCSCDFCSNCKHPWHGGITCEENTRLSNLLTKEPGIPFDNDLIKCCPMCSVPIEKDEGCAQMMCKRCKHVFCWYCLASLDDDFLLRHYDKGPCKNKLGHSRASVIWHRTQVIGIFAGFGILLLVASPLLLLAAPCIVCCKCRVCSGGGKLDAEDDT